MFVVVICALSGPLEQLEHSTDRNTNGQLQHTTDQSPVPQPSAPGKQGPADLIYLFEVII